MTFRKKLDRFILVISFAALCFVTASCGKPTPTLTLSAVRIPSKQHVGLHGTGFTPKANVISHLRKPDGTEFPILFMLTDSRGEISHDIDTLLMDVGTHDLWIIDETSGVSSNVVHFEVTLDQPPPAK